MYTKSIVHRDLKPENIAFVENIGTWKIIDFGFSKKIEDKDRAVRATILGSAEFKAP